jgi:hypothetical protein
MGAEPRCGLGGDTDDALSCISLQYHYEWCHVISYYIISYAFSCVVSHQSHQGRTYGSAQAVETVVHLDRPVGLKSCISMYSSINIILYWMIHISSFDLPLCPGCGESGVRGQACGEGILVFLYYVICNM